MNKILKTAFCLCVSSISVLFLFIPDEAWKCVILFKNFADYLNIMINRIIVFVVIFLIFFVLAIFFEKIKYFIVLKSKNHNIVIKYGDILKAKKGLILVHFDECFTSKIGKSSGEIKKSSLCGQFLMGESSLNIESLIKINNIKPELEKRSKFRNKDCYKPGTILPYKNYLLMSFARLDKNGLAEFESLNDYLDCLSFMWEQIYIYHGDSDVCVPVLGCGRTKIKGRELNQQELLDIMIFSYKLSDFRLKKAK